eukprot:scaffold1214_cov136-Isochrysis_galbana.AAC.15
MGRNASMSTVPFSTLRLFPRYGGPDSGSDGGRGRGKEYRRASERGKHGEGEGEPKQSRLRLCTPRLVHHPAGLASGSIRVLAGAGRSNVSTK